MSIENHQLHLFDLVTIQRCSLSQILAIIPQTIEEIFIYFSTELLNLEHSTTVPYLFDYSVLMVRGVFAAEGENFMLPRSARC
ncbi:hypothetical protein CLI64_12000 [Nostoc sp. CENA543]|uniref:hypothetical protein n=1 Tax=Nostoc sp. CENA543 TaxID=1869241 RepID=UPI000CA304CA|nr:hypothetical protein [Nostoc sp. CENA543]AUT01065.1 hypothetical protein CLI64_12000 [Nostoc sp. CENA543]